MPSFCHDPPTRDAAARPGAAASCREKPGTREAADRPGARVLTWKDSNQDPRRELPILDKFYTLKKEVYFFMPGVKILLPLQRYTCQQWQMNHFIWFGWIPRDGVPAIFSTFLVPF